MGGTREELLAEIERRELEATEMLIRLGQEEVDRAEDELETRVDTPPPTRERTRPQKTKSDEQIEKIAQRVYEGIQEEIKTKLEKIGKGESDTRIGKKEITQTRSRTRRQKEEERKTQEEKREPLKFTVTKKPKKTIIIRAARKNASPTDQYDDSDTDQSDIANLGSDDSKEYR